LRVLGISNVREPKQPNGCSNIRVTGGLPMRARFFSLTGPAISRKLDITGRAVKSDADLRVMSIEDLGVVMDMIDIQTGTGDFIANGVVSHNCFARKTHEYLDFDSGKDFDTQIVVKVNVAEVLAKELARPSWGRHPVALGTNTDPYQRAEGRYRLMPGIIAALAASDTPFSILTKGTLLRRDLPLCRPPPSGCRSTSRMTIDVFDAELRESVEPGAPTTEARLATVAAVKRRGLDVSVFLMPVLPFLTDSIAHLERASPGSGMPGPTRSCTPRSTCGRARASGTGLARTRAPRPGPSLPGGVRHGKLRRQALPRLAGRTGEARCSASTVLERPPRPRPGDRGAFAASGEGTSLIAAELPAHAAAGIQPTLF
jgi:hypothetical protein